MENFNNVPSQGKFGDSVAVVNENFMLAQQEMEILRNLISPDTKFVTVNANPQTTSVTQVLPETGSTDTVYRVGSWDGIQYNDSVFSEYAWNGTAYIKLSTKSQAGEVYDISANHSGAKYADLSAALSGTNVPVGIRRGGMSVKFVQSSDNKYVQYRLMTDAFSITESDWQGVDDEPTAGSNNLVKSGGVSLNIGKAVELFDGACVDGITIITNNKRVNTKGLFVNSADFYISGNSDYEVTVLSGNSIGVQFSTIVGWTQLNNVKVTRAGKYVILMFRSNPETIISKNDLGIIQILSEDCFKKNQTNKYARIYNENYGIGAWTDAVLNISAISKTSQIYDLRIYCLRNIQDDDNVVFIEDINNAIPIIRFTKPNFIDIDNNGIKKYIYNSEYCSIIALIDFNKLPCNTIVNVQNGLRIPMLTGNAEDNAAPMMQRLVNKRNIDVSEAGTGYYRTDGTFASGSAFKNISIDVSSIGALKVYARTGGNILLCKWVDASGNEKLEKDVFFVDGDNLNYNPLLIKPQGYVTAKISWVASYGCTIEAYDIEKTKDVAIYPSTLRYAKTAFILPVAGQSLSIGAEATPSLSTKAKYGNTFMVNGTEFKRLWDATSEKPGIGMVNKFLESLGYNPYSNEIQDNIFITPNAGSVGITIAGWISTKKDVFLHSIEVAVNNAVSMGYTPFVPAMAWIQGEADIYAGTLNWKDQMIALYTDLNSEIKEITGQSEDIKIALYQSTTSQCLYDVNYGFNNGKLLVPTQQMELVRDDARFIAGVPTYSFETVPTYNIHLTNKSSYMLGAYLGKNTAEFVSKGYKNKGLVPMSFEVNENDIVISYNVPCAPMKIDIDSVAEVANYGFNVINSENNDIIESVSICYDKVYIKCTASPIGCKLRYGLNGAATHTATEDPNKYNGGRLLGGRGNLRDSEENIAELPSGDKGLLYNWAYCFETLLT